MMKKNFLKYILLVLLAGSLALFYFLAAGNDAPERTGKLFTAAENEEITSVLIKNTYGSFSFAKKEGEWMVSDGSREFYTNADKMKLLTNSLLNFPVLRILDETRDEYGLAEPTAAVSFVTSTGRTGTAVIGASGVDVNEYYALASGIDGVLITDATCVNQLNGSLSAYRTNEVFIADLYTLSTIEYYRNDEKQIEIAKDGENGWKIAYPFESGARKLEMNEFVAGLLCWTIAGYPDEFIPSLTAPESVVFTDEAGTRQKIEFGYSNGTQIYARIGARDDIVTLYNTDIDLSVLNAESLIYENPLYYPLKDASEVHMSLLGRDLHFLINNEAQTVELNGQFISYEDFTGIYFRYVLLLADGFDPDPHYGKLAAEFSTLLSDGSTCSLKLYERDSGSYYMEYADKGGFYLRSDRLTNLMEKLSVLDGISFLDK